MPISSSPAVPSDGVVTLGDGTGVPLTFIHAYEDGDFKVNGISVNQREIIEFFDRDTLYALRYGKTKAIEFSFTGHLVGLTDATSQLLADFIRRKGAYGAVVSTFPAASGGGANGVWTHSVAWGIERSDYSGTDNSLALKYCATEFDLGEGTPATISVKGKAYVFSTDYLTVA